MTIKPSEAVPGKWIILSGVWQSRQMTAEETAAEVLRILVNRQKGIEGLIAESRANA